MNTCPILYIVVPCYNEEAVLPQTSSGLNMILSDLIKSSTISSLSKILFVDDGSSDNTWDMIHELSSSNSLISGLKLSRNFGHQNALLAGLEKAKEYCDCSISMDADLQDDLSVISEFIEKYRKGSDIVYGVRMQRKSDSFFKRFTAHFFYKLMVRMRVNIIFDHADYRLMSSRALQGLSQFREVNLFLRGIVPTIGYKSDIVYYDRKDRTFGVSKYPLKKMLSFALDGITSFSVHPIRIITITGFIISMISIFSLLYTLFIKFFGYTVSGWTSLIISIWFLGGFQIFAIGLIGEYIGKIYKEVKARPRYIIEEFFK